MGLIDTCKGSYPYIVIIPLIPLCFYPVQGYIKSSLPVLLTKIVLCLGGFFMIFTFISHFLRFSNMYLTAVCAGVYFFYFYDKEIRLPTTRTLFIFLTVCLLSVFSFLFGTVIDYTLHPTSNYMDYSKEAVAAQFAFLVAANGVFYIPLSRYLRWIVTNYHVTQIWKGICLFPLIFVPILSTIFPHEYRRMQVGRFYHLYLVILVCLFCFILMIYFLFYKITYAYVMQQKIEHSNRILAMQGSQYQQLLRSVQENSRIRHDFRHQLIIISELLKQKEYTKLEEYIQTYVDNTETKFISYSYSAAVNALISYYGSLCQNKDIQTDFSLHLPDGLSLSDQDLCIMLGNLLENAIYGCQDTKAPYIHLKVRQTSPNILAVKIENPYRGIVKKVNGRYLSTKHDRPAQGLESVHVIAEKHHGMMEIHTDKQIFTVKILLQISVESKRSYDKTDETDV